MQLPVEQENCFGAHVCAMEARGGLSHVTLRPIAERETGTQEHVETSNTL